METNFLDTTRLFSLNFLTVKDLLEILDVLRKNISRFNTGSPVMQILDNGHGGIIDGVYQTQGKMFDHGDFIFYEGLFNRLIVWLTAFLLKNNNKSYYILVPEDEDISLQERVNRINKIAGDYHSPAVYVHSVHGNAAGVNDAVGIEVYTSPGQTLSDSIATLMYNELIEELNWKMRSDFSDGDPDKEARFYILVQHPYPAVLSENGFFTNKNEAMRMLKFSNILHMAQAFCDTHKKVESLNLFKI